MKKQCTIAEAISFEGKGLHTGVTTKMTIEPEGENFGIQFKRTDLDGDGSIKADVSTVISTNRGTFLESSNGDIATVEHVLAALAGAGVDNVIIKIDGPEIPILDGSSKLFSEEIDRVGVVEQEKDATVLQIVEPIQFVDEKSGASYIALPSEQTEYTVMIDFDSEVLPKQFAQWDSTMSFQNEIAHNRTFVFAHELLHLMDQDLIKGGELSSAIVFSENELKEEEIKQIGDRMGMEELSINSKGILNNLELHSQNEPAKHKLLDLIGDLSLVGASIKGRIIATKPGHTGNVAFAKELKKLLIKQRKNKGVPRYDSAQEPVYDLEQIKKMLPHRYPFLLVDKIIEKTEKMVVGIKNITFNEGFFMGHFPGNPVFPGVLQMEALAQTGGILALASVEEPEKYDTYFLKMDAVKFKQKVVPGDTLILKMELLSPIRRGIVQMKGTVYVGEKIVSEGELVAQIVKAR